MNEDARPLSTELNGTKGRYRLGDYLGGGRTASVYRAEILEHAKRDRQGGFAAVKLMAPGLDEVTRRGFFQEVGVLMDLQNAEARLGREARDKLERLQSADPNLDRQFAEVRLDVHPVPPYRIPEVWDVQEGGPAPFFVMTLAPGKPLDELLRTETSWLPEADALDIISQALSVFVGLHEGLSRTYLDFQPRNVFWEEASRRVTVIDWNLLAPADDQGIRSDVQALARLLYRMLTGFSTEAQGRKGLGFASRWGELSYGTRTSLLRALDPRPGQGWPTARSFYEELRDQLALWSLSGGNVLAIHAVQAIRERQSNDRVLARLDLAERRGGYESRLLGDKGEDVEKLHRQGQPIAPLSRGRDFLRAGDLDASLQAFERAAQEATSLAQRLSAWRWLHIVRAARADRARPGAPLDRLAAALGPLETCANWGQADWGHAAGELNGEGWPGIETVRREVEAHANLRAYLDEALHAGPSADPATFSRQIMQLEAVAAALDALPAVAGQPFSYRDDAWAFIGARAAENERMANAPGVAELKARGQDDVASAIAKLRARAERLHSLSADLETLTPEAYLTLPAEDRCDPIVADRGLALAYGLIADGCDTDARKLLGDILDLAAEPAIRGKAEEALAIIARYREAEAALVPLYGLSGQWAARQGRDLARFTEELRKIAGVASDGAEALGSEDHSDEVRRRLMANDSLTNPPGATDLQPLGPALAAAMAAQTALDEALRTLAGGPKADGLRMRAGALARRSLRLVLATGQGVREVEALLGELKLDLAPDESEELERARKDQDLSETAIKKQADLEKVEREKQAELRDLEVQVQAQAAKLEEAEVKHQARLQEQAAEAERRKVDLDAQLAAKEQAVEAQIAAHEEQRAKRGAEIAAAIAVAELSLRNIEERLNKEERERRQKLDQKLEADAAQHKAELEAKIGRLRKELGDLEGTFSRAKADKDKEFKELKDRLEKETGLLRDNHKAREAEGLRTLREVAKQKGELELEVETLVRRKAALSQDCNQKSAEVRQLESEVERLRSQRSVLQQPSQLAATAGLSAAQLQLLNGLMHAVSDEVGYLLTDKSISGRSQVIDNLRSLEAQAQKAGNKDLQDLVKQSRKLAESLRDLSRQEAPAKVESDSEVADSKSSPQGLSHETQRSLLAVADALTSEVPVSGPAAAEQLLEALVESSRENRSQGGIYLKKYAIAMLEGFRWYAMPFESSAKKRQESSEEIIAHIKTRLDKQLKFNQSLSSLALHDPKNSNVLAATEKLGILEQQEAALLWQMANEFFSARKYDSAIDLLHLLVKSELFKWLPQEKVRERYADALWNDFDARSKNKQKTSIWPKETVDSLHWLTTEQGELSKTYAKSRDYLEKMGSELSRLGIPRFDIWKS